MKILFIHDHKFIEKNGIVYTTGGLPNTVWQNYLINKNIKLTVFGRLNNSLKSNTISSSENVFFKFSEYYNGPKDFFLKRKFIDKELSDLIRGFDKIIIRLPSFLGIIASEICQKNGKKYYSEVVANGYDSLYNYSFLGKFIANFYHNKSKKAISESNYALYVTKNYLQEIYPCKNIVDYASDVEIEENNYINDIISLKNKKYILCGTVGNLEVKFKGYEIFFKVIKKLKFEGIKVKYQIAGAGNSDYLKNLLYKYDIVDNVEFLGKLNREEIKNFYNKLDIYIHPSFQEGLPRVVVEAMNFNNAVLASTIGGIPELIEEKFLHKPGDYKKLYEDFKLIYNDDLLFRDAIIKNKIKTKEYQREKLLLKRQKFLLKYLNE